MCCFFFISYLSFSWHYYSDSNTFFLINRQIHFPQKITFVQFISFLLYFFILSILHFISSPKWMPDNCYFIALTKKCWYFVGGCLLLLVLLVFEYILVCLLQVFICFRSMKVPSVFWYYFLVYVRSINSFNKCCYELKWCKRHQRQVLS